MPVGVADRDVVAAVVVSLEDRDDLLRREPVDRGDDRRLDQAAVRERQEVEVVVDQVELRCALEHRGDVQALPHLGVELRVLRVPGGDRADQRRGRQRVGGGEQRDVHAARDQPFRQERDELLPRAVVARRHPPRDRGQHRHTERGARHDDPQLDPARRTSPARTPVNVALIDDDRPAEQHVIDAHRGDVGLGVAARMRDRLGIEDADVGDRTGLQRAAMRQVELARGRRRGLPDRLLPRR